MALIATMIFALAMGIGIFFITPLFLTTTLFEFEQTALEFNLTAGAIRILILLGYLAAISLMKDIKRHGRAQFVLKRMAQQQREKAQMLDTISKSEWYKNTDFKKEGKV